MSIKKATGFETIVYDPEKIRKEFAQLSIYAHKTINKLLKKTIKPLKQSKIKKADKL